MKSITIHGIDEQLANLIKSKAESEGLSVNKTVKKILEVSLGVRPQNDRKNLDDFKEFCGVWTQADLDEFEEKTADFGKIDKKDWQ
jgi:hypothetical protein